MDFTHLNKNGDAVMVDVGGKPTTRRRAVAAGHIHMSEGCFAAVQKGQAKKGDVLGVARVAGIMAAKQTARLIPLCHGLGLTACQVDFALLAEPCRIEVVCTVQCEGQTGVEMEALTGASVALLTVYDMCKAMDKNMEIGGIRLLEKSGGKGGHFHRTGEESTE